MPTAFERIRALALAQLACIEDGDIDGYLAGVDAFEASLAANLESPDGLARAQVEELVAIDRATREQLDRLKESVARQLAEMNGNRRASAAYLATTPPRLGDARSA